MKKHVVIDTNVLLVAEGESDYSWDCRIHCAQLLLEMRQKNRIVLDEGREILTEYGNKLRQKKGQPGMGYQFWKWLVNTGQSYAHCDFVPLTTDPEKGYEQFPDHEGLHEFDRSDRKFVAVAVSHSGKPDIVQAGDSKWWGWQRALNECGVMLFFPCEEELKLKWESKFTANE